MIYTFSEIQKIINNQGNILSKMSSFILDPMNEISSDNSLLRHIFAANEMLERNTKTYSKPDFSIKTIEDSNGKEIEIIEKVVLNKTFCNLLHFEKQKCDNRGSKVFLIAPLSGHWSTLLRDTVGTFLKDHDVYISDWKDASDIPLNEGSFGFGTYVDYLLDFLRYLGRDANVVAVCQPAVPALAAISILAKYDEPSQPKTMTLMGGPIDTRINPGQVNNFSKEHSIEWFEKSVIMKTPFYRKGAGRSVCPGFLMLNGFMALNLVRHKDAIFSYYQNLIKGDMDSAEKHRKFYDEYRAVMDLPSDYFLESVKIAFQEHLLPKVELLHNNDLVDPSFIKETALLTVEGELDDISCLGQTYAAHDICKKLPKKMKNSYVQKNVGHYGIFNGKRFREKIYPKISEFIALYD